MSKPLFWLQIVDEDGVVVTLPGGGQLEADLIEHCTRHIMGRGVGLFCSEAHVDADVRAGLTEAILELKKQTLSVVA